MVGNGRKIEKMERGGREWSGRNKEMALRQSAISNLTEALIFSAAFSFSSSKCA